MGNRPSSQTQRGKYSSHCACENRSYGAGFHISALVTNRSVVWPGFDTIGLITELPLSGQLNDMPFTVQGRANDSGDQTFDFDFRRVNDKYFRAMRIPLLRGRNFTEKEVTESAKLLIISELLA